MRSWERGIFIMGNCPCGDIVGVGGGLPIIKEAQSWLFWPIPKGGQEHEFKLANWTLSPCSDSRMWDSWRPYLSQQSLQGTDQPVPAQVALAFVPAAQSLKTAPCPWFLTFPSLALLSPNKFVSPWYPFRKFPFTHKRARANSVACNQESCLIQSAL